MDRHSQNLKVYLSRRGAIKVRSYFEVNVLPYQQADKRERFHPPLLPNSTFVIKFR